jgi:hypothetical protein
MNLTHLPEVLPEHAPTQVKPIETANSAEDLPEVIMPARKTSGGFRRFLRAICAWTSRWLIGAAFCLNYFTSIVVFGWTYRWMRALVLKSWWKQSNLAKDSSFRDYCDSLGLNAPTPRPRFIMRDRVRTTFQTNPDRRFISQIRHLFRILTIPVHSLWLNFKTGFQGLLCTYLFTGWGCLLMLFGWEYGWLNSFHKGYEASAVGILTSFLGMLLFILAMYYVLMAQVHHAVTGERAAFFDFGFVWKLIQARPTSYCGLVMLMALLSLPIELMKVMVIGGQFFGNNDSLTHGEVLRQFLGYLFLCSLVFFPMLLLIRGLAARIYSSAVLKVLRSGTVSRSRLHPTLAQWLDDLDIKPVPVAASPGLWTNTKKAIGWMYRNKIVYVLMFVLLFAFIARKYVGEFLVNHPVSGLMNHELVQFPTLDVVPFSLWKSGLQDPDGLPPR